MRSISTKWWPGVRSHPGQACSLYHPCVGSQAIISLVNRLNWILDFNDAVNGMNDSAEVCCSSVDVVRNVRVLDTDCVFTY